MSYKTLRLKEIRDTAARKDLDFVEFAYNSALEDVLNLLHEEQKNPTGPAPFGKREALDVFQIIQKLNPKR